MFDLDFGCYCEDVSLYDEDKNLGRKKREKRNRLPRQAEPWLAVSACLYPAAIWSAACGGKRSSNLARGKEREECWKRIKENVSTAVSLMVVCKKKSI